MRYSLGIPAFSNRRVVGGLISIALFAGLLYLCLTLGEKLLAALEGIRFGALHRRFGFFSLAIAVQ
ncbi:hypothetical protein [Leptolyngbya sp. FACHB-17]|uniref:hypothetical protein n=1 Tax=unclassified Leptolyngbya TaxID=2650499 RepID=UPI0016814E38|nr:hypothetical protein [Leptolyngbya sp. FACHB-17]MBD2079458.1 hypothetical protein [Leptolyngbya sp. FACHB-17]